MSNTKKPKTASKTRTVELGDGLTAKITDTEMITTHPGGTITIPLTLDLEGLFGLFEAMDGFDDLDASDVTGMLLRLRGLMPAGYIEQTRGVDAGISLKILMAWVEQLGARVGKAFT